MKVQSKAILNKAPVTAQQPIQAEQAAQTQATQAMPKAGDAFGDIGQKLNIGDVSNLQQGAGQKVGGGHPALQVKFPAEPVDAEALKGGIERAISDMDWNAMKLDSAPNVEGLVSVFIDDQRMLDGPMKNAFVNTENNTFYLEVTGAGMAGPDTIGPFWYGPMQISANTDPRSKEEIVSQVRNAMSRFDYSNKLTSAPDLSGMEGVVIADKRPVDGALVEVNIDHEAGEYYVTTSHYNRIEGGEVTSYFGPFDVDHEYGVGTISGEDIRALKTAWNNVRSTAFQNVSDGLPNDVPLKAVILENDRDRGMFDGFQYTAHFMPGTSPADGARFWIERTGGIAGMTQVAGPFRTDA